MLSPPWHGYFCWQRKRLVPVFARAVRHWSAIASMTDSASSSPRARRSLAPLASHSQSLARLAAAQSWAAGGGAAPSKSRRSVRARAALVAGAVAAAARTRAARAAAELFPSSGPVAPAPRPSGTATLSAPLAALHMCVPAHAGREQTTRRDLMPAGATQSGNCAPASHGAGRGLEMRRGRGQRRRPRRYGADRLPEARRGVASRRGVTR
jgi:hypothetical protein